MEIVHNTQEIISEKNFLKKFPPYWPYDVILTPKNARFEHFEQFFADFRLFDHYNIKNIQENYGGNCLQCSGDYCKINFFPKFIALLALWRHLNPQSALFEHFEQFFADFAYLTSITLKLSYKTMVEIVQITQEITLK